MKNFRIPIILSVLIHILLIWTIVSIRREPVVVSRTIRFFLNPEPAEKVPVKERSTEMPQSKKIQSKRAEVITSRPVKIPFQKKKTSSIFNTKEWEKLIEKESKKRRFLSQSPAHSILDSLNKFSIPFMINKNFKPPTKSKDLIRERMEKITQGTNILYFQNPKEPKKKHIRPIFDFLPNELQIEAMALIFSRQKATQIDIYPQISISLPITAELLDRELKFLVDKGFLTRKIISPQNILMITTPFFAIPLEMSAKNRRNKLFLYSPNLKKEKLISYLQSRLFLLEEKLQKNPLDSSLYKPEIKRIEKMIRILL